MISRSIGTALLLSAAVMVLSGGGCSSGGGGGDNFFAQTWSDATPNTSLAEFLDQADGEKISITQHTGSMTLSDADIDAIVDFFFFAGDPPDLSGSTLEAIADGSDENRAYFMVTDTADNDFIFSINSTGELEMLIGNDTEVDPFVVAAGVTDLDTEPVVGDDVAGLVATLPGEDAPHFGTLDYMSVVAWATTGVPDDGATEATVDFGVGHLGLATPEADMPTEGEAFYDGQFVGVYVEPGTGADGFVGVATGDAEFTADFGEGTVEGGVHDIFVAGIDLTGAEDGGLVGDIDFVDVTIGVDLDVPIVVGGGGDPVATNTFYGGVVPGEGGFADFDEASTGSVDGVFYGPVNEALNGPEEAGAVLTLQDAASEDFITGVIGAGVVD